MGRVRCDSDARGHRSHHGDVVGREVGADLVEENQRVLYGQPGQHDGVLVTAESDHICVGREVAVEHPLPCRKHPVPGLVAVSLVDDREFVEVGERQSKWRVPVVQGLIDRCEEVISRGDRPSGLRRRHNVYI